MITAPLNSRFQHIVFRTSQMSFDNLMLFLVISLACLLMDYQSFRRILTFTRCVCVCVCVPSPAVSPTHSRISSIEEEQRPLAPHLHTAPPAVNNTQLSRKQQHVSWMSSVSQCLYFLPLTSCRRSRLLCSCCCSVVTVATVSFGGRPRRPRLLTRPAVTWQN